MIGVTNFERTLWGAISGVLLFTGMIMVIPGEPDFVEPLLGISFIVVGFVILCCAAIGD